MIRSTDIKSRAAAETACLEQGLDSDFIEDDPGKVYSRHAHHSVMIFSLNGSVELELNDSEPALVGEGDQVIIPAGMQHQARVGEAGWSYVIGWSAEEAQKHAA